MTRVFLIICRFRGMLLDTLPGSSSQAFDKGIMAAKGGLDLAYLPNVGSSELFCLLILWCCCHKNSSYACRWVKMTWHVLGILWPRAAPQSLHPEWHICLHRSWALTPHSIAWKVYFQECFNTTNKVSLSMCNTICRPQILRTPCSPSHSETFPLFDRDYLLWPTIHLAGHGGTAPLFITLVSSHMRYDCVDQYLKIDEYNYIFLT